MPYLPLGSLDMYIPHQRPERKSIPPRVCRRIAHQALKGLHHLHRNGYIHLDIKPGNIMFSSEGILKLVDFGEMVYMAPQKTSNNNSMSDVTNAGTDFYASKTHQVWDGERGTYMYGAPELGKPFSDGEDKPTYTYKDHGDAKRFYYCEREKGTYDSCGFNHKVDIYALGITLLNMARGYEYLVQEPTEKGILTCCKELGKLKVFQTFSLFSSVLIFVLPFLPRYIQYEFHKQC